MTKRKGNGRKKSQIQEISREERNAVQKANKFSSRRDEEIYSKPMSHDVVFDFLVLFPVVVFLLVFPRARMEVILRP